MFMSVLIFSILKPKSWGGLLFISMSIFNTVDAIEKLSACRFCIDEVYRLKNT